MFIGTLEHAEGIASPAKEVEQFQPVQSKIADDINHFQLDEKLFNLCKSLNGAELLPDALKSNKDHDRVKDLYLICVLGRTLGLTPVQSIFGIYCVNGVPALYTRTKRAIALQRGCTISEEFDSNTGIATCTVTRNGFKYKGVYSVQDAVNARKMVLNANNVYEGVMYGSKPSPWKTDPKHMLQTRAQSRALDLACADYFMGLESYEFKEDFATYEEGVIAPTKAAAQVEVKTASKRGRKAKSETDAPIENEVQEIQTAETIESTERAADDDLLGERPNLKNYLSNSINDLQQGA